VPSRRTVTWAARILAGVPPSLVRTKPYACIDCGMDPGLPFTSRNASRKECFHILARSGEANVALSCRPFAANAVRLQLHALAYNLGNFLRTLAMPEPIKDWLLTSLKERLIKIGAKLVSHGRYVAFQMAESPCRECCSPRSCG
jgi:hypothetical protein